MEQALSLNGILASGVSTILANSAALRVTADNIANINTPGYVRRVVNMEVMAQGGQLSGVALSDIQRITNNYLDSEVLAARSASARYDAQAALLDRLDTALGQPGDGTSLGSRIDAIYAALGQASLDPSALSTRLGVLTEFEALAQTVNNLSTAIADLRASADQQIGSDISHANELIRQIYELNPQISRAQLTGDPASGLLDERDKLVGELSDLIGIRTSLQSDGRLFVSTTDGVQLVSDTLAELVHQPSVGPTFNPILVQTVHPDTGAVIGIPRTFDSHVTSGELRGLLDARDNVLLGLGEELGTMMQTLSLALNAQHNASAAFPPPSQLDGRQTGLLSTDALNFSGATAVGIVDANGVLVHNITIDFDAGTISVDGGGPSAIGSTIGSFAAALDTALGADGDADFTNGVLTVSANGGNGLVISDDAGNPSSRAGIGFSHFFGLNDLFRADGNAIQTTGLSSTDAHGLAPGGEITLLLKGPDGKRVSEATVAVTGTTIGDMVTALNTAFAGNATFTLDANGQLQVTPAASYSRYELEVTLDSTARGSTGEGFTSLFGIGTGEALARASAFGLAPGVAGSAQRFAFAQPTLSAATAVGTTVVTPGDNRGLLRLQDTLNQTHAFAKSGALPGRTASLTDYAAAIYQDISSRSATIDFNRSAQQTRLMQAQRNQSSVEGVNLDEELEKMMVLQQAYNAGARLITLAQQLYQELLDAVRR
jgi:flagellar hook-associated protein 1 FlgK